MYKEIQPLTAEKTNVSIFTVYPNPCKDWLKLNFTTGESAAKIRLLNMQGIIVLEQALKATQITHEIALTECLPGTYLLAIFDEEDQLLQTKKVEVQGK